MDGPSYQIGSGTVQRLSTSSPGRATPTCQLDWKATSSPTATHDATTAGCTTTTSPTATAATTTTSKKASGGAAASKQPADTASKKKHHKHHKAAADVAGKGDSVTEPRLLKIALQLGEQTKVLKSKEERLRAKVRKLIERQRAKTSASKSSTAAAAAAGATTSDDNNKQGVATSINLIPATSKDVADASASSAGASDEQMLSASNDESPSSNKTKKRSKKKGSRGSSPKSPRTPRTPRGGRRRKRSVTKKRGGSKGSGSEPSSPAPTDGEEAKMDGADHQLQWQKGELIGKGSFGKVYMGMEIHTGQLIAVKQIRLTNAIDEEKAKVMEQEISIMKNLRHPNIVHLIGTERTKKRLNILMEYVPGNSLDAVVNQFGGLGDFVMQSYTRQLLLALDHCHKHNVVHRDLKGKNVLVDTNGNIKLADFGSAKYSENASLMDSPSMNYNYTPLWTAPEVLGPLCQYNHKVDIWSLGCVIIEMGSGQPPWSEESFENPFRALFHIGNSDATPKLPDTLSAEGRDFAMRCLQRDPEKRPAASELLNHPWVRVTHANNRFSAFSSDEDGSDWTSGGEYDDDDEDEVSDSTDSDEDH
eukprot:TRINITY_DN67406_c6_g2_i3.p1 TRINITY_DN67406_c6_g2~~TRINITY_DN67406_c6_g2_i3.p1  ORF type:complete len:590 (-),score=321.13 TRINITY_DN67406_c6_g2_i3:100-1869(-)